MVATEDLLRAYRWQLSTLRKVNAICLIQNILHSASIENNLKLIMYECRLQSRHVVLARIEWQRVHRLPASSAAKKQTTNQVPGLGFFFSFFETDFVMQKIALVQSVQFYLSSRQARPHSNLQHLQTYFGSGPQ